MKTTAAWLIIGAFFGAFAAVLFAGLLFLMFARPLIQSIVGRFTKRLMSERYSSNIWEMVTALTRTSPIAVIENSLRAASGMIIERPFGSPRKFLNFDGLIFSPAQLAVLPAHEYAEVDMTVTIGPKAIKPLTLDIPLMAGAMGYGIGVSEKVKIAIAKGTAAVGTLTNTGEGGFLPEDRAAAKYLIIQYNSGTWSKEPEILRQADAIEIHFGQGATVGTASFIPSEYMQGRARQIMKVKNQDVIVIPARHREIQQPEEDLKKLVDKLRQMTGGVPIGVKICASARIEADLDIIIQAGVDFISIDGGQAGTKGGPPILEDDFGLPTIYALSRAVRHLRYRGVKDSITLLSGGGYAKPGDCLKALALGADGIFMGTALLWAMTHDQVTKAIPWEPPTQLTFYPGSMADQFNEDEAAVYLQNFFTSCVEEMKLAIRALGKTSLRQVNVGDLVALDDWTSKVTKIPLAYDPVETAPNPTDSAVPEHSTMAAKAEPATESPIRNTKDWFSALMRNR
ncbi:FMN-binding glutamate synthase family protein [Paenibacillus sp. GCM10027628]|uniref:FMN-binding glutamate synthase family protein n=1 Tax=Paenibacillus sp. GCM10027628 TaxID=3273413 RepID=UPI003641177E